MSSPWLLFLAGMAFAVGCAALTGLVFWIAFEDDEDETPETREWGNWC